jgi:hypothetical protein
VTAANARELGLNARLRHDKGTDSLSRTGSIWAVAARPGTSLDALDEEGGWTQLEADPRFRAWTDDYTNLLAVLRWRR